MSVDVWFLPQSSKMASKDAFISCSHRWERSLCDRYKYAFYERVRSGKETASGTGMILTVHGSAVDIGQLRGMGTNKVSIAATILSQPGASYHAVTCRTKLLSEPKTSLLFSEYFCNLLGFFLFLFV